MAYEFRHRMRVEFAETDMAGIVHFSQFFRYMEVTEHAFLRSVGLSVHTATDDGRVVSWPRGRVECSYKAPLRFEDEFDVHLLVREKKRASITYAFRFLKNGSQLVAEGTATTICVEFDRAAGRMSAIPIPEWFHQCVDVAPPHVEPPEGEPDASAPG
jgi:YbgC/YbaW family acyl-CoA thioester hydrolase